MKALEKVRTAGEFFKHTGIDNPIKDAELIIAHCLGINRMILYKDNPQIQEEAMSLIETYIQLRAKREPLQYILGYTEFHGLKICVGPGVLIPRPETELLVEEAIKILRSKISNPPLPPFTKRGGCTGTDSSLSLLRILDLCTGSGCIALALAKEFPDTEIYGTDTSETAIQYAEENAKNNGIKNVTFLKGSLFEPLIKKPISRISRLAFDLIISNPPYIKKGDIITLQPEIGDWEPVEALNGGADGLDYYRGIMSEAKNYLKMEGVLMFEIGIDQAESVKEIARGAGFENISLKKDYAGIDRIMTILQ
jgi:release factor glutamine methyltransferase